jgi:hypothetical protein
VSTTNYAGQHEPLTYKRQTVVDKLKEQLAQRQEKRQKAEEERKQKNDAAIARLNEALNSTPQFLLELAGVIEYELGVRITEEDFVTTVANRYAGQVRSHPKPDPDEDINRLIRVYESAEDDTVKVYVSDAVYRYL